MISESWFAIDSDDSPLRNREITTIMLEAGRVDAEIRAATIGLSTVGKNPTLGPYRLLNTPVVPLPGCFGIQQQPDARFAEGVKRGRCSRK
jgi:polar amino acid transport system substrate-binding protein